MALPKIKYPTFMLTVPSTGEMVKFRPFTVAEEKVLLMSNGGDVAAVSEAVIQVIEACFFNSVNVRDLPSFDIEYLFLNLRAKSVSELIKLEYRMSECPENNNDPCGKTIKLALNVESIKVQRYNPETDSFEVFEKKEKSKEGTKIMLDEGLGVTIKYPNMTSISKISSLDNEYDQIESLITDGITTVFDEENVYTRNDFSPSEMKDWFNTLTSKQKDPLLEFIKNIPQLKHDMKIKCKTCGKEEVIELQGLQSFL